VKRNRVFVLLLVIASVSVFAFSHTVEAATFKDCAAFNGKYPNGIAKTIASASKQKTKPKVSISVYRAYRFLDRDGDGTVCEVTKPRTSLTSSTLATIPSVSSTTITSVSSTTITSVSSTTVPFTSEVIPFDGTVTGAYLGPRGSSTFPPTRSFVGKTMCDVQSVKSVNFNFGIGTVTPCSQNDFVMLKFSGLIPKTNRGIQSLRIQASHDDGIYLSIDGLPVLDNWRDCVCNSSVGITNIDLNADHSFEVWYYENDGEAFLNLKWQSAIPTSTTRPVTSISVAPSTATTAACSPNQQAISSLKTQAGNWLGPNRDRIIQLMKYEGSQLYGLWGIIYDANNSNYNKTLAALNLCKVVNYKFDDYDKILSKARFSRDLKSSDSITFAISS
jgi:Excalibur calcium-binding domain